MRLLSRLTMAATMDGEVLAAIIGTLGLASAGTYSYLSDRAYDREKAAEEEAAARKQETILANELALDHQRGAEGFPPLPGLKPDSVRSLADDLTGTPAEDAPTLTEDGKLLRYEGRKAYVFEGGTWKRAPEHDR